MRPDSDATVGIRIPGDGVTGVLLQRVVTAIVLIAGLVLVSVFASPFAFALAVALITILCSMEWTRFIGLSDLRGRAGYVFSITAMVAGGFFLTGVFPRAEFLDSFRVLTLMLFGLLFWILAIWLMIGYPRNARYWNEQSHLALMGVFVLVPTWSGVVQLKYLDPDGGLVLALIAMVSVADIGAYFAGRAWGRKKLAPNLSPGKSWAGFWGGMASCVLLTALILLATANRAVELNGLQILLVLLGAMLVSISSVVGDLFESMMKRNRQLKDSGTVLPGHGGILDRLDSLTAATPVAVLWLFLVLRAAG